MMAGGRLPPAEHGGQRLRGLIGLAASSSLAAASTARCASRDPVSSCRPGFWPAFLAVLGVILLCFGSRFGWRLGGLRRLLGFDARTDGAHGRKRHGGQYRQSSLRQSPSHACVPRYVPSYAKHLLTPKLRQFAHVRRNSPGAVAALFHSHRLGEVARLIHVGAHEHRRMIGEKLHRHRVEQRIGEGMRRGHRR